MVALLCIFQFVLEMSALWAMMPVMNGTLELPGGPYGIRSVVAAYALLMYCIGAPLMLRDQCRARPPAPKPVRPQQRVQRAVQRPAEGTQAGGDASGAAGEVDGAGDAAAANERAERAAQQWEAAQPQPRPRRAWRKDDDHAAATHGQEGGVDGDEAERAAQAATGESAHAHDD